MKTIFKFFTLALIYLASTNCHAQYYTGQKVFKDKFPSETKDYNQDTYLKIENDGGDIIVAIENTRTGRVIQHAYINSRDTYKFKYLPVGSFVCKYMWTDNNGRKHFQKDNSIMNYGVDEVGGYVITLEETQFGNLSQTNINESEFFD
tara:strand:+ start:61 stop:504 length:444 start_codon:yes stop_codon:yes gene_type:complete